MDVEMEEDAVSSSKQPPIPSWTLAFPAANQVYRNPQLMQMVVDNLDKATISRLAPRLGSTFLPLAARRLYRDAYLSDLAGLKRGRSKGDEPFTKAFDAALAISGPRRDDYLALVRHVKTSPQILSKSERLLHMGAGRVAALRRRCPNLRSIHSIWQPGTPSRTILFPASGGSPSVHTEYALSGRWDCTVRDIERDVERAQAELGQWPGYTVTSAAWLRLTPRWSGPGRQQVPAGASSGPLPFAWRHQLESRPVFERIQILDHAADLEELGGVLRSRRQPSLSSSSDGDEPRPIVALYSPTLGYTLQAFDTFVQRAGPSLRHLHLSRSHPDANAEVVGEYCTLVDLPSIVTAIREHLPHLETLSLFVSWPDDLLSPTSIAVPPTNTWPDADQRGHDSPLREIKLFVSRPPDLSCEQTEAFFRAIADCLATIAGEACECEIDIYPMELLAVFLLPRGCPSLTKMVALARRGG